MHKQSYVYILGNQKPVLYIGVISDLVKRIYQHKHKMVRGFSYDFNVSKLLYYEVFESIGDAFTREKQLKNWHRDWKLNLIKTINPEFKDLYPSIL